ncbi:helix-turn-helix domain-containing protein [Streptomyces clavuligerus]|uniref:Regulatory protein n=1 Tax=Streptomyces clavuligerus TaxID=1901 RepID=E2Q8N8_STRCL|nr:helix-turn-helix transcriptional regulator [Streptomyces clavuligerus]ANW19648.1 transcriptional regulator [Streptomyces clavuligerus]AXU14258.1 XRE family transcriptional regulator [Streptomyces clavuligerus]EFG07526.1 Regulatory protein [Streptomyces clavuligerus]MBY6304260.1 helix-turn-helix domain-containing protein [Streptomyces clavuligerus]QCS07032.1 XRE family transcriptional regulator [Streptomyces clavuligerus]
MPQKPRPLDDLKSTRDWWGVELRNWRRVRKLSSKQLGELVNLSGTSIERIEKNERPCDAVLAGRFDDVLDAGGALRRLWSRVEADKRRADADNSECACSVDGVERESAGILKSGRTSPLNGVPPVERRVFVLSGGAALPVVLADLIPRSGQSPPPTTVHAEDIEQVGAAATTLAKWDNLHGGGGMVREASIGHLTWAKSLLEVKCPPGLKADLFTAVGRLAITIGASAFDAYEHENARKLVTFGVQCAEAADNWHLRARALNVLARQDIWLGSPDTGLTHAENGLVRADRLTSREQAMLHNARARAWARMENHQETLAAIGQSDDAFSRARPGEDVAWMSFYDHAQHYGDTGHALFDIALLPGQSPREAAERLRTAVNGHTQAYVRSRALSGTKLATLMMSTGDPNEAVATGHRALDEVGRLSSRRAVDDVRALARAAARYKSPEVSGLRLRIKGVVQA